MPRNTGKRARCTGSRSRRTPARTPSGVFGKAAESVTVGAFFADEDMENDNFEKALEITAAGGI